MRVVHVTTSWTRRLWKISRASSSEPHFWAIDLTKWFYWSKTIACMLPMLLTAYFKLPIKYRCKILNPIFFSTVLFLLLFDLLSQISWFVEFRTSSILRPDERPEEVLDNRWRLFFPVSRFLSHLEECVRWTWYSLGHEDHVYTDLLQIFLW